MLPFECPPLMMPITGPIASLDSFEYLNLTDMEKKLLLGLKISLTNEINQETSDQWIVWLAFKNNEFILHLWKPITGEMKQLILKKTQLLPIFDENNHKIKLIQILDGEEMFYIFGEGGPSFMSELCELLEIAATGVSSKFFFFFLLFFLLFSHLINTTLENRIKTNEIEIPRPQEFNKTKPKDEVSRESIGRDSESHLTPEDIEKQRKRRAIGSVSMRRLSLTGRGNNATKKSNVVDHSPRNSEPVLEDLPESPPPRPELVTRKSVMSSVFGSITENDDT